MGEMNSLCGGGQPGLSDSFSSALWAMDTMFEDLNVGVDGVNWHSGQYTAYELFEFRPVTYKGQTKYYLTSVKPLYYGLLMFSEAAGNGARLIPVALTTSATLKAWATLNSAGQVNLLLINKDLTASGEVSINLPGYTAGAAATLSASSYQATTGVSLAGQTFDGSLDGTLQGQKLTENVAGGNGAFSVKVIPSSAVLITFNKN
jgi:hypothetical protein